jgi:ribulose-5-phosphate 4-epimerase/fuculose-1-phosphate aldolase
MKPELIRDLVIANHILSNEGILDGLGHISTRNPENSSTFFIARSVPPISVTEEDIMEVDLDGNPVGGSQGRPVSERFLHALIYKQRKDVNAIFHGHHPKVLVFSLIGERLQPVCHLGSFLYQGVPVFKSYEKESGMLISSPHAAEKLAKTLRNKRAILMYGHGYVVVGETLRQTVAEAIYMVVNADIQLKILSVGKRSKGISRSQAKETMKKALFDDSPLSRMWDYWVQRLHQGR